MVVYTSSSYILECERISWTVGPNGNRTASLKDSAGCCRRIDNFDSSNEAYIQHDITPTNGQCSRLQSTERVRKKIVASTGTGKGQCIILNICHPSRNGLLVACRQPPTLTIWIAIGDLIVALLRLLDLALPFLKKVNQYSCIFNGTCVV